ncbi:hypothetical protein MJ579_01845 [Klebsiella pneumoniae]|nr:hypothetical protein MJ579_01845 [Klebsiella pneumoniae]
MGNALPTVAKKELISRRPEGSNGLVSKRPLQSLSLAAMIMTKPEITDEQVPGVAV